MPHAVGSRRRVSSVLITVEVQGQLHTYVHECGSKDRIDPGLRGQWVWLWVTPMSKITRVCVGDHKHGRSPTHLEAPR